MAACPKISRGGIFEKFSARGGIPKIPPTPLFPLPDSIDACVWHQYQCIEDNEITNERKLKIYLIWLFANRTNKCEVSTKEYKIVECNHVVRSVNFSQIANSHDSTAFWHRSAQFKDFFLISGHNSGRIRVWDIVSGNLQIYLKYCITHFTDQSFSRFPLFRQSFAWITRSQGLSFRHSVLYQWDSCLHFIRRKSQILGSYGLWKPIKDNCNRW